ncbi:MAG: SMP-30/gluconolactonase/LRE family protein [Microcella sp.]|nr:SMP-30/gluconolactonase/LRE family protein [Microcella sp.]
MMTLDSLGFPEALRWHDGALWFSDMFRSRVMRWVPGADAEVMLDAAGGGPTVPGGLGWLPDEAGGAGDLLVVDCERRRVLRLRDATVTVHANLSHVMTHSANDMHVDADGTAWVGGYGFDPEADEPVPSPLVRVGVDGSVSLTEAGFVFPNGCERDATGALLVAETFGDRVSSLTEENELAVRGRLPHGSGPDGLSIAPDGAVYVALAFAGALARLAPATAGPDAEPTIVHRAEPVVSGPGAGPRGIYDCAVHPDGERIAVAMASLDEALAERVDTGRVDLVDLRSLDLT